MEAARASPNEQHSPLPSLLSYAEQLLAAVKQPERVQEKPVDGVKPKKQRLSRKEKPHRSSTATSQRSASPTNSESSSSSNLSEVSDSSSKQATISGSSNANSKQLEAPEASDEEIPLQGERLLVDNEYFEGVASAYRYKVTITNMELYACALNFVNDVDVFSFAQVNKKRAVKKEEWPFEAPLQHPQRCDVKIQLFAGKTEIKTCAGCSMWKDLTSKPFLVLTPQGTRCVQYLKQPFILLIFRCCPKFHSYTKQFRLAITVTSAHSGKTFSTVIRILRKKMNNKRKRSPSPPPQPRQTSLSQDGIASDSLQKLQTVSTQQTVITQQSTGPPQIQLPPVINGYTLSPLTANLPFTLPSSFSQVIQNNEAESVPVRYQIQIPPMQLQPPPSQPSFSYSLPQLQRTPHVLVQTTSQTNSQPASVAATSGPGATWDDESVSNFLEMESRRVKDTLQRCGTTGANKPEQTSQYANT